MAAGKSINDMVATAKGVLKHAQDFDNSIPGKHEYSQAPYSLVRKPEPQKQYSLSDEAKSAGEGIKERMETERKALQ
jgi:hypothetical protein